MPEYSDTGEDGGGPTELTARAPEDCRSGTHPVLLNSYAAKQCPRRVHNWFDRTLPWVGLEARDAGTQLIIDAGLAHEAVVFDAFITAQPAGSVLRLPDGLPGPELIAATVQAMHARTPVILGGRLPDDHRGHRTGKPDVLLYSGAREDGHPTYVAGDAKAHRTFSPPRTPARTTVTNSGKRPRPNPVHVSTMSDPLTLQQFPDWSAVYPARRNDALQLAHYFRMLRACGFAEDRGRGFIIGTRDQPLPGHGPLLTWVDLSGGALRSTTDDRRFWLATPLQHYDRRFVRQRRIAEQAHARQPGDPPAKFPRPIGIPDCDTCPWLPVCRDVVGPDDAAMAFTVGRLPTHAWSVLHQHGVETLSDLAALDPATSDLPNLLNVPDGKLTEAIARASMLRDGILLQRRGPGPAAVPRADVEIDLDAEWDPAGRVYLWGTLLTRDYLLPGETAADLHSGRYLPVGTHGPVDEDVERVVAHTLLATLYGEIHRARQRGKRVAIYHWSPAERVHLTRILHGHLSGARARELQTVLDCFIDLKPVIDRQYVAAHGLGIKKVAPAVGFAWADEDPGGLQSQAWLARARDPAVPEPEQQRAWQRIVAYNADDCRATQAVRFRLDGNTAPTLP